MPEKIKNSENSYEGLIRVKNPMEKTMFNKETTSDKTIDKGMVTNSIMTNILENKLENKLENDLDELA
jgi:hypothetical protein